MLKSFARKMKTQSKTRVQEKAEHVSAQNRIIYKELFI